MIDKPPISFCGGVLSSAIFTCSSTNEEEGGEGFVKLGLERIGDSRSKKEIGEI